MIKIQLMLSVLNINRTKDGFLGPISNAKNHITLTNKSEFVTLFQKCSLVICNPSTHFSLKSNVDV
jgi:hypothetical protein